MTAALPDGHKDSLIRGDAVLYRKTIRFSRPLGEESGDEQMECEAVAGNSVARRPANVNLLRNRILLLSKLSETRRVVLWVPHRARLTMFMQFA